MFRHWFALLALLALAYPVHADDAPKQLRAGMIGLDTSHVVAFTDLLNNPSAKGADAKEQEILSRVRIVAAYPGGSPDVPASRDRVEGYTKTLRDKYQVEIVDSIDTLLSKVDVVFLESVDGRPQLEQARPVLKAHKPVFIDKPVAGSLADAVAIYELAKETGTPVFSSSSLRFSPPLQAVRTDPKVGNVLGCAAYSPCSLEPHHPDLFWYGIHGVEELYTVMGPGCTSVSRVQTKDAELVTGTWHDGRIGTFRGLRAGKEGYGVTVFGQKAIVNLEPPANYKPLVVEICRFFQTHKPPVSAEETLEIYTFMEAADESKRQGGAPVTLESVMQRARRK